MASTLDKEDKRLIKLMLTEKRRLEREIDEHLRKVTDLRAELKLVSQRAIAKKLEIPEATLSVYVRKTLGIMPVCKL